MANPFQLQAKTFLKLDQAQIKRQRQFIAGSVLQKIGLWIRKVSINSIKRDKRGSPLGGRKNFYGMKLGQGRTEFYGLNLPGGVGRDEQYSRPNKPYKMRDRQERPRKIYFDMNAQHTMGFVGPVRYPTKRPVQAIHEFGDSVVITGKERRGRQTKDKATGRFKPKALKEVKIKRGYRPRPVMGPATAKSKNKLAEAWGGYSGGVVR